VRGFTSIIEREKVATWNHKHLLKGRENPRKTCGEEMGGYPELYLKI
jgi:hypothetical protein